jgi:hypothetical protein
MLKNAYNAKITQITGNSAEAEYVRELTVKDLPVIHWVAVNDAKEIIVKEPLPMFDEKEQLKKETMLEHKGFAETAAADAADGAIIQFERFAFCKKDGEGWILTQR